MAGAKTPVARNPHPRQRKDYMKTYRVTSTNIWSAITETVGEGLTYEHAKKIARDAHYEYNLVGYGGAYEYEIVIEEEDEEEDGKGVCPYLDSQKTSFLDTV